MKAEFNVNSPINYNEANEIVFFFKGNQFVELYCGKDIFVITNIGVRRYKYPKKNIMKGIISKIEYTIKNNI